MHINGIIGSLLADISLPDLPDALDLGLAVFVAIYVLRLLFAGNQKSRNDSWEMLKSLVESLEGTNKKLVENNQSLIRQIEELEDFAQLMKTNQTLIQTNNDLVTQLRELGEYHPTP